MNINNNNNNINLLKLQNVRRIDLDAPNIDKPH